MIAINFTTARGRLKDFCDRVTDRGETVIVTRKAEKNVVIISEERFNELEKAERNAGKRSGAGARRLWDCENDGGAGGDGGRWHIALPFRLTPGQITCTGSQRIRKR